MAISGIGRPVVLNDEGVRTLEKMLLHQKRLIEANKDLVRHRALRRDFTTVKTLSQVR